MIQHCEVLTKMDDIFPSLVSLPYSKQPSKAIMKLYHQIQSYEVYLALTRTFSLFLSSWVFGHLAWSCLSKLPFQIICPSLAVPHISTGLSAKSLEHSTSLSLFQPACLFKVTILSLDSSDTEATRPLSYTDTHRHTQRDTLKI